MTPEGKVKDRVKQTLKRHGIWFFMPPASAMGKAGVPDFVCIYPGRKHGYFLGIETKAGGNDLTAMQRWCRHEIISSNGLYLVVNESNIDTLDMVLDSLSRVELMRDQQSYQYDTGQ